MKNREIMSESEDVQDLRRLAEENPNGGVFYLLEHLSVGAINILVDEVFNEGTARIQNIDIMPSERYPTFINMCRAFLASGEVSEKRTFAGNIRAFVHRETNIELSELMK